MMERAVDLLEDALASAINHPDFMGFMCDGITEQDVEDEGGDAAFVTADIAWRLDDAIFIIRNYMMRRAE